MSIPAAAGWQFSAVYNEELSRDIETKSHIVWSFLQQ